MWSSIKFNCYVRILSANYKFRSITNRNSLHNISLVNCHIGIVNWGWRLLPLSLCAALYDRRKGWCDLNRSIHVESNQVNTQSNMSRGDMTVVPHYLHCFIFIQSFTLFTWFYSFLDRITPNWIRLPFFIYNLPKIKFKLPDIAFSVQIVYNSLNF